MRLPTQLPVARLLFVATILAGSFLLFLVQPMIARMALPRLGGAPNVWNSAMIVYQSLLLAGYAYAHHVSKLAMPRQWQIHIGLMVLFAVTLPLALYNLPAIAPGWEVLWVPLLLLLTVGPVFFIVSAQAPLMQRWFAAHPSAGEPWALYAASNVGSFVGLIAYPLLAEPLLSIDQQSLGWSIGYGVLVLLVLCCAMTRRSVQTEQMHGETQGTAPAVSWRQIGLWISLSAIPSGLMLSTTTHLTTDIFAMPLLWVIPLGLYLLSFVVAFSDGREAAWAVSLFAPAVVLACGGLSMISHSSGSLTLGFASMILLFSIATTLHAKLYEARPDASRLTGFYLAMSIGGALGGAFTAILAPVLFDWVWEHPLLILAAAVLMPLPPQLNWRRNGDIHPPVAWIAGAVFVLAAIVLSWMLLNVSEFPNSGMHRVFLTVMLCGIGLLLSPWRVLYVGVLGLIMLAQGGLDTINVTLNKDRSRSYFGIYTIIDHPESGLRQLVSGTTLHGQQWTDPVRQREPSTYYGRDSGAALALAQAPEAYGDAARIGIVGLGTGTLACMKSGREQWTFFEIDPAVVEFSRNGTFTYLSQCTPDARIVVGDARLKLAEAQRASFDVLVIDAFTSDAIPLHLLTRDAFGVYFDALTPDGIAVLHISNRFIDLEPVVAAIARDLGLAVMVRNDTPYDQPHLTSSAWVALARDPKVLEALADRRHDAPWEKLQTAGGRGWTDDYASILPYIRWNKLLGTP